MIPKILAPRMKVNIPNIKKDIYVKPYTVEIEKTLILSDNKDAFDLIKLLYGVVKDCVLDDSIDVDKLKLGEFVYLFTQIQKISTKEELELVKKHNDHDFKVTINLNDLKLDKYCKGYKIDVSTEEGDYVVEIDHPTVKDFLLDIPKDDDNNIYASALYVSAMYSKDGNNELELTLEDRKEILSSLPLYEVEKVSKLVSNNPMPYVELDVECPVCHEHIKEKVEDFFM